MSEEHALIEIQSLDVAKLFSKDGMTEILAKIRERAEELKPDLETDAGRKEIASMAYKVARSKTLIDNVGKETISEWKKKLDGVNKYRKQARDYLDDLKTEVRKPLTDWEEEQEKIRAEKERIELERIEGIQDKIAEIKNYPLQNQNNRDSGLIKALIKQLENIPINEEIFMEFQDEAQNEKDKALTSLRDSLANRLTFEKEQEEAKAESERLEKERKKQEEERKKIEEEKRKIEEEKAKLEAERKAERERKEKEEFERQAKEQAEREAKEKLEREEQERKEQEKREAEEKVRQEALKPDKDKLCAWADTIASIVSPETQSIEAQALVKKTEDALVDLADSLVHQAMGL